MVISPFFFSVNHKTLESGWTETAYTLLYDVQRAGKDFHTIMIVIIITMIMITFFTSVKQSPFMRESPPNFYLLAVLHINSWGQCCQM